MWFEYLKVEWIHKEFWIKKWELDYVFIYENIILICEDTTTQSWKHLKSHFQKREQPKYQKVNKKKSVDKKINTRNACKKVIGGKEITFASTHSVTKIDQRINFGSGKTKNELKTPSNGRLQLYPISAGQAGAEINQQRRKRRQAEHCCMPSRVELSRTVREQSGAECVRQGRASQCICKWICRFIHSVNITHTHTHTQIIANRCISSKTKKDTLRHF